MTCPEFLDTAISMWWIVSPKTALDMALHLKECMYCQETVSKGSLTAKADNPSKHEAFAELGREIGKIHAQMLEGMLGGTK